MFSVTYPECDLLTNRGHGSHGVSRNVRSCRVRGERSLCTDATPPDPVAHSIWSAGPGTARNEITWVTFEFEEIPLGSAKSTKGLLHTCFLIGIIARLFRDDRRVNFSSKLRSRTKVIVTNPFGFVSLPRSIYLLVMWGTQRKLSVDQ